MSNKLSRILVGVDFSEPSFNALATASRLAEKDSAVLYLVYAQELLFERIVSGRPSYESYINNSSGVLTALATDISRKYKIKTVVIEAEAYAHETILRNIVSHKCDLAVMGTYGASGFRSGYIGTVAYTVAKYAPCPVLLVPAGQEWTLFRKPLFPVRPVMTAMRHYNIIRRFLEKNSSLQIIGLSRKGEEKDETVLNETLSEIEDALRADEVTTSIGWNTDKAVSQNILAQADKTRSDLIILTTAIDVSNKQFFIGPISHHILHNARIPVLVINKMNLHSFSNARNSV